MPKFSFDALSHSIDASYDRLNEVADLSKHLGSPAVKDAIAAAYTALDEVAAAVQREEAYWTEVAGE